MDNVKTTPLQDKIFEEYAGLPVPRFKMGQKVWIRRDSNYLYGAIRYLSFGDKGSGFGVKYDLDTGGHYAVKERDVFATADELRESEMAEAMRRTNERIIMAVRNVSDMNILPSDLQPSSVNHNP